MEKLNLLHLGFLFTAECGEAKTDISQSLGLCVLVPVFVGSFLSVLTQLD